MKCTCGRFAPFLIALVVTIANPAQGWNATGHQVVAEIAWNDLKPAVREKISALLKEHPHFARTLASSGDDAKLPEEPLRVFMRAAIWPDLVRSSRGGKEPEFHHGDWHYIDFPIIAPGTDYSTLEIPPLEMKLEPGTLPHNALQAMELAIQQLKDPDVPAAEKAVALAWLEHLVGDLHQPLHAAALFSRDYPKGDRGGNLFVVKSHGKITNLHSYWDELLGGYMSFKLVDAVAEKAGQAHPRTSLAKELSVNKIPQWATESFALARDVAYDRGNLKGVTRDVSAADKGETTLELPHKYDETAHDTARRRAALAGYRLADLLNKIFE